MAVKASERVKRYQNPNGPTISTVERKVIEQDGLYFKDIDGTGTVSAVNDWRLTPAERAEAYVKVLTTSEKIVVMGTWLAWVLIIVGFLMVVEYMRDSIRRQTELGNLSDESIRTMLYRHKTGHRPPANVEARPDHSADTLTIPATLPTKEGKHAR